MIAAIFEARPDTPQRAAPPGIACDIRGLGLNDRAGALGDLNRAHGCAHLVRRQ